MDADCSIFDYWLIIEIELFGSIGYQSGMTDYGIGTNRFLTVLSHEPVVLFKQLFILGQFNKSGSHDRLFENIDRVITAHSQTGGFLPLD
jgi:hypothetical protein